MIRKLFLLTAALWLTACGRSEPGPCPSGERCLHVGNVADPGSLDPPKSQLTIEDNIISDLLVGLTTDDAAGRVIPGVAAGWRTSPDGLTWTFDLRPCRWSDGTAVTAADVVFSLRRLVDPKTASPYAALIFPIVNAEKVNSGALPLTALGVQAIGAKTVVISLLHPTPYLPQLLKHQITYIVPEHIVRRWGDAWIQPDHFVGEGPYLLKSWVLGDKIALKKNPLFYDAEHVCLDEVSYYPTADAVSAMRRVKRGELDIAEDAQSSRIAFLRRPGQMPRYVHTATYLGVDYLTFNHHVAALQDGRVRRALSLALDREFYARKLLRAGQLPADGFVPPGVSNYPTPASVEWAGEPLGKRRQAARKLLAEAGYGPNHPLTLELKSANHGDATVLPAAAQSDWAAVGVRVTLQPEEGQIFYADLDNRNYELAMAQWIADYDDAMSFLYLMRSETGVQNYGDYKSAAYDAAIAEADRETDLMRRAAVMRRAEQIMLADDAVAPVYFLVSRNLVNPNVVGWVDNIMDHHRKRWMCLSAPKAKAASGSQATPNAGRGSSRSTAGSPTEPG